MRERKLIKSYIIDGKPVTCMGNAGNLNLYRTGSEEPEETTIYFVNKSKLVVSSLEVRSDMSQGSGYLSRLRLVEETK